MGDWASNFDLNFSASFYHVVNISDGMGGVTLTKVLYATIPCAFWQLGASEIFINDRIKNPTTHKLFAKPISGVLASDLIKINGIEYRIDSPDNIMGFGDAMTIGLYLEG
jgi:hypothetical protein